MRIIEEKQYSRSGKKVVIQQFEWQMEQGGRSYIAASNTHTDYVPTTTQTGDTKQFLATQMFNVTLV